MGSAETKPSEEQEFSASRLRLAVARLSRRLRTTEAAGSFTPSEVDVLRAAARAGPTRLSDLASFVGVNPTMLSRLIPKLEMAGLVRRLDDKSDKRVCLLEVSAKGQRLLERISRERNDLLSRRIAELARDDREALGRALPVLEQLVERLSGEEPEAGEPPGGPS